MMEPTPEHTNSHEFKPDHSKQLDARTNSLSAEHSIKPVKEQTSGHDNEVQLSRKANGVAVLRLGAEGSSVVTFSKERLESLRRAVEQLKANPPEGGLIITGPTPGMFAAGADISEMEHISTKEMGAEVARVGQDLFNEIEKLPCHKVAAIGGIAAGGGYEIALACNYRIASSHKRTKIGLPETNLGIIPAWGGTQRLARLVGPAQAITIMNEAKLMDPHTAKKWGMVDEVVAPAKLEERAEEILQSKKTSSPKINSQVKLSAFERQVENAMLDRGMLGRLWRKYFLDEPFEKPVDTASAFRNVARRVPTSYRLLSLQKIHKLTQGLYPSKDAVVYSVVLGLMHGMEKGLEHDAKALGELLLSPESKNLRNLFYLGEASKRLGRPAKAEMDSAELLQWGTGIMGSEIGGVAAKSGNKVTLVDYAEAPLEKGKATAKAIVDYSKTMTAAEKQAIYDGLEAKVIDSNALSEEDKRLIASADIIIEAIPENPELKNAWCAQVSPHTKPDAVLGSNTSTNPISDMQKHVVHPERFLGIHFFNPVRQLQLVEIIRGEQTSQEAIDKAAAYVVNKMGKQPIVVEDVPGFLINRLLFPYLNETMYLLQDGYSIEHMDSMAKRFGMPMGPVNLLDVVGLDVCVHAGSILAEAYGDRMVAPPFIKKLVEEGRLGKKNGQGFYTYEEKEVKKGKKKLIVTPDEENVRKMLDLDSASASMEMGKTMLLNGNIVPFMYAQKRLILAMVNEGIRCLDEGVAQAPGKDAADRIDLGTVKGIGFAPFRGGLVRYAESVGAAQLLEELKVLHEMFGERFKPWRGIEERARSGKSFYESIE